VNRTEPNRVPGYWRGIILVLLASFGVWSGRGHYVFGLVGRWW